MSTHVDMPSLHTLYKQPMIFVKLDLLTKDISTVVNTVALHYGTTIIFKNENQRY